eukprot:3162503-Karenia_brevis.AAC.1
MMLVMLMLRPTHFDDADADADADVGDVDDADADNFYNSVVTFQKAFDAARKTKISLLRFKRKK